MRAKLVSMTDAPMWSISSDDPHGNIYTVYKGRYTMSRFYKARRTNVSIMHHRYKNLREKIDAAIFEFNNTAVV